MKIIRIIAIVAAFGLVGVFCISSLESINQDIGRHLKTGEIIWQTKHVPSTNLFSFTEPNTPFINHHWFSEVVFYLLNLKIGLPGLIVFKAAIFLLVFALLYLAVSSKVTPLSFVVALMAALLAIGDRTDLRPEIFSYLAMACFLFAIFRAKYNGQYRWLYYLPLVELFWANMHIYFPFGIALMGLFALDRLIIGDKRWKKVAWITAACAAVILINPNGLAGAMAPFTILQNYGYSIVENQSLIFLKDYGVLVQQINVFVLVTVVFFLSFIPRWKKWGIRSYIFESSAGLVFAILAMMMVRNVGPFAIIMAPILALNLEAYWPQKESMVKYDLAIGLCILFAIGVIGGPFSDLIEPHDRFGLSIPAGAQGGVDFVLNNHLRGPVFNNFDVGSYLIWKLYPDQQVFVDGRPEAYTVNFFEDIYKPMQEDPQVWQHYADDVYHINYIFFDFHDITPWARMFLTSISTDPNWPLVYHDGSVVIFVRRTPQNMPLIQQFSEHGIQLPLLWRDLAAKKFL